MLKAYDDCRPKNTKVSTKRRSSKHETFEYWTRTLQRLNNEQPADLSGVSGAHADVSTRKTRRTWLLTRCAITAGNSRPANASKIGHNSFKVLTANVIIIIIIIIIITGPIITEFVKCKIAYGPQVRNAGILTVYNYQYRCVQKKWDP